MSSDVPLNTLTNSSAMLGGSIVGEIKTSGDTDWHAVSLMADETYIIDLKGADGEWGTLADPLIRNIYDASGSYISGTYDDDPGAGKSSYLEFRPEASVTYYINASAYESIGTYTLSVKNFADIGADLLASELTTSVVTAGGFVNGEIESSRDMDWHAVSLEQCQLYAIDLKGFDSG